MLIEPAWLPTEAAANYIGTTCSGIRNRVYRGQLKPYKPFGRKGRSYFKKTELDQILGIEFGKDVYGYQRVRRRDLPS